MSHGAIEMIYGPNAFGDWHKNKTVSTVIPN